MWRAEDDSRRPKDVSRSIEFSVPVGFERSLKFSTNQYRGYVEICANGQTYTVDTALTNSVPIGRSTFVKLIANVLLKLGVFCIGFGASLLFATLLYRKLFNSPQGIIGCWKRNWSIPVIFILLVGYLVYLIYYSGLQGLWLDELCQVGFCIDHTLIQALEYNLSLIDGSAPLFPVAAYF